MEWLIDRHRAAQKKWRESNPGYYEERAEYYRKTLSALRWEVMKIAQNGLCAICKIVPPRGRLCVDHNHVTGKIRGLLCDGCNMAIGNFREDPVRMKRAIEYLRVHMRMLPTRVFP
jgi:hypothetical protein